MSKRPWYKRYGGDFVFGTMSLSLEEKGAYSLCLDLIYDRGSPIPDDARWLAGICGVSVRKWRALRDHLIETGKLFAVDGTLTNARAQRELASGEQDAVVLAENGAKGGRKRAENAAKTVREIAETETESNKNNEEAQAPLKPNQIPEPDIEEPPTPKGVKPGVSDAEVEACWSLANKISRGRSSKADLRRALEAALRRGHAPARIALGLQAYFASDDATKDEGSKAKAIHRMVENDRWESWAPATEDPNHGEPIAPASEADTWRARLRRFRADFHWPEGVGGRPGRPDCSAPTDLLAEFGFVEGVTPITAQRGFP